MFEGRRDLVAAIDLGSNSFHMIVGRLDLGKLHVVDRMREPVRLAAGLDKKRCLTEAAQKRALEVLDQMGERVRGMPSGRVRAVGTNALRQARNAPEFLERAHQALGHPIEVIGGREEARLIYLGVLQTMPLDVSHRLVIDIGGGSTECILGARAEMLEADSLFMGCVSFTQKYFPDGELSEARFVQAELAARLELQPIVRRYKALGWDAVTGCSGTVHAIKRILTANGWANDVITAKGLRRARRALIDKKSIWRAQIPGLTEDRRPVLAGGVAILNTIMEAFGIEEMLPSPGALREGALYDLVGRIRHEDVRDRTIRWFCEHYAVDMAQVGRVERTALRLLPQVAAAWGLDRELGTRLLSWASQLHEIGLSISHTGYHKHGAYVVANADMAGFSRTDQTQLAILIRSHRRKIREQYVSDLEPEQRTPILRLAVLFRLAVALNRSRSDETVPPVLLEAKKNKLLIELPRGWLDAHSMTMADLMLQASEIERIGVELVLADSGKERAFPRAGKKRG